MRTGQPDEESSPTQPPPEPAGSAPHGVDDVVQEGTQPPSAGDAVPDGGSVAAQRGDADAAVAVTDAPPAGEHVEEHTDPVPTPKKRSVLLRVVTVVAVLFTAWHVFASLLWIAPYSPAREVVPGKLLTQYMIPFFGQSWSVFAPEPINGDNRMFVRAVVAQDGSNRTTEWVNVTDVETQLMTHQLFPARAGNQSINLASDYRDAYAGLTETQKQLVAKNFSSDGWATTLSEDLYKTADASAGKLGAYIAADFMSTRYSTQVARAIWGENVVRVQFRMERQNVIPFKQRHNPDAKRPGVQLTPSGWRGLQVATGQDDKAFADTFKRLYKELHP